jgi:thiosulfate/3-mercaptopyruvate sulfurtransferase
MNAENLFEPRAWWLLIMGREGLGFDGGLPAWIKEGYATEKKTERYEKGDLLQISTTAV